MHAYVSGCEHTLDVIFKAPQIRSKVGKLLWPLYTAIVGTTCSVEVTVFAVEENSLQRSVHLYGYHLAVLHAISFNATIK